MANIAEGFGRGGNRKFSQFLGHSRGSIAELKSHLYVALDAGLLVQADFEDLFAAATKTESQVSALIGYLAKTEHRGPRLRKNREP
jgi:four helix bundle protein